MPVHWARGLNVDLEKRCALSSYRIHLNTSIHHPWNLTFYFYFAHRALCEAGVFVSFFFFSLSLSVFPSVSAFFCLCPSVSVSVCLSFSACNDHKEVVMKETCSAFSVRSFIERSAGMILCGCQLNPQKNTKFFVVPDRSACATNMLIHVIVLDAIFLFTRLPLSDHFSTFWWNNTNAKHLAVYSKRLTAKQNKTK